MEHAVTSYNLQLSANNIISRKMGKNRFCLLFLIQNQLFIPIFGTKTLQIVIKAEKCLQKVQEILALKLGNLVQT